MAARSSWVPSGQRSGVLDSSPEDKVGEMLWSLLFDIACEAGDLGLTFLWVGQGTAGKAGGFPGYGAGEGSQVSQAHLRHCGTLTSWLLEGPNPAIGLGCQRRSVCGNPRGAPGSGDHRLLLRRSCFSLVFCYGCHMHSSGSWQPVYGLP